MRWPTAWRRRTRPPPPRSSLRPRSRPSRPSGRHCPAASRRGRTRARAPPRASARPSGRPLPPTPLQAPRWRPTRSRSGTRTSFSGSSVPPGSGGGGHLLDVRRAPLERTFQWHGQALAEGSQGVLDGEGSGPGDPAGDEPELLELAHRLREHLLGDPADRALQLAVAQRGLAEGADDEGTPLVDDGLEDLIAGSDP